MAPMPQMQRSIAQAKSSSIGARVAALNWTAINSDLDDYGCAATEPLLTPEECAVLAESYDSDQLFRTRIIMARHGFGRGEYKYFAYPLPQIVAGNLFIRPWRRLRIAGTRRLASRQRIPQRTALI